MSRALFYVDALPEVGEQAVIDGDEGFHAASVRRIRRGEQLDLSDGAGALAHCVIEDVGKARLTARVLERTTVPSATPAVTVVQALPKSDRSELAIELAAEAGARFPTHAQPVEVGVADLSEDLAAEITVPLRARLARTLAEAGATDALEVAADAGATAVIHPGGSKGDDDVLRAAEERGMAVVLTGRRHFRH